MFFNIPCFPTNHCLPHASSRWGMDETTVWYVEAWAGCLSDKVENHSLIMDPLNNLSFCQARAYIHLGLCISVGAFRLLQSICMCLVRACAHFLVHCFNRGWIWTSQRADLCPIWKKRGKNAHIDLGQSRYRSFRNISIFYSLSCSVLHSKYVLRTWVLIVVSYRLRLIVSLYSETHLYWTWA